MTEDTLSELERALSSLATDLAAGGSSENWQKVELTAQALANGLRVRDGPVDNHSALGQTGLANTLQSLLQLSLRDQVIPTSEQVPPVFEVLRVAANLCMDHDENRGRLLDAGLPQTLVALLKGYTASVPPPPYLQPFSLSLPHLRVIRTSIGVLLNASIGYEPVKLDLIHSEAAIVILKLSAAIYPPGVWLSPNLTPIESNPALIKESWQTRSLLSSWAWRTISELKDIKDEALQVLGPEALPYLTLPLLQYTPPFNTEIPPSADPEISTSLLVNDFDCLEESCTLLESLSLDVEDIRLSLARGFQFPSEHNDIPCLSIILDFVEKGTYHPLWKQLGMPESDRTRREKEFDICKAALVKLVVEVAGEESNENVLWDDSVDDKPGGEFIFRMVKWLKGYAEATDSASGEYLGRDDLAICAGLSIGNLTRKESSTSLLLAQPYSLGPVLASRALLSSSTDIKIKHGIIGLLKHMAQSSAQSAELHTTLHSAGIVKAIAGSGIWDEKTDAMADAIQLGAIGAVKHLCNIVVENIFDLVLPSSEANSPPTGLDLVLALVKRSDSVPIKSEGTRILVNVIKGLWSSVSITGSPVAARSSSLANGVVANDPILERTRKREAAMQVVLSEKCASALADLVGKSKKYPILVNEGVVAMSLLSTTRTGAPFVLSALLKPALNFSPVPPTEPPSASTSVNSDVSSPVMTTPSTHHGGRIPSGAPVDLLTEALADNPANFQIEVRVNICALFLQITRNASGDDLERLKEIVRPVVLGTYENVRDSAGKDEMLAKAAKRLLDSWTPTA